MAATPDMDFVDDQSLAEQMLSKVCHHDPPPPNKINSKIHRDVVSIGEKSIEKEKTYRYQIAQKTTEDIDRFLDGEPIQATERSADSPAVDLLVRSGDAPGPKNRGWSGPW
jgi:hypothetical protein